MPRTGRDEAHFMATSAMARASVVTRIAAVVGAIVH